MEYLIIASAVCMLDQVVKYLITMHVPDNGYAALIPGVIHLTNIQNRGAAFSMLSRYTWLLTLISAVGIAVLLIIIFSKKTAKIEKVFLALALGGAIGNFIDRLLFGYVVDMFDVDFMRFAVFNFADICINVGGIGFCILFFIRTLKEDAADKTGKAVSEETTEETMPDDKENIGLSSEQDGDDNEDTDRGS